MRALEVVGVDEQRHPPHAVGEVREHRPGQELVPERLPEPLDLAERLRVLRPALHVPDAVAPELLLERGLAAPGRVLPALVGEHLRRRPERRDAPLQRLHHEARALVVRDRERDDEAAVVVEERGDVEPLVAPQQEGEDVRLPELVRRGALEAPRRVVSRPGGRRCLGKQPFLVQDAEHLRRRDAERLETAELVADAAGTVLRVRLLRGDDLVAPGVALPPRRRRDRLRLEPLEPGSLVALDPLPDRAGPDAERACDLGDRRPAIDDLLDDVASEAQGVGVRVARATPSAPTAASSVSLVHPVTPLVRPVPP